MKICVIQPPYAMEETREEEAFEALLSLMDACDPSMDMIVLPEYSDIPGNVKDPVRFREIAAANRPRLIEKVRETARRTQALTFVNYFEETPTGLRNTTFAYGKDGGLIGKYNKAHPAPSEVKSEDKGGHGLDTAYSYEPAEPVILTIDGLKYAFLTCYDFYFYEYFPVLARENVDFIIGCSLQRTDPHSTLEIIGRFVSYQTNAYLVRSSVSMGSDSPVCGSAMVVSPSGEMLLDMGNDTGLGIVEIDPSKKYVKPAGFGGKLMPHHDYIEVGRRPWLYRPAGPGIVKPDDIAPYPRLCAHRGFSKAAPENTMPAFGSAVALGASEIEFDLWSTKDGELVSMHDDTLERVSNGTGKVGDHTLEELRRLDFGSNFSPVFAGLPIVTFEEILKQFACRVIMNIHVKIWDTEAEDRQYGKILALLHKYDCEKYVYMMTVSNECLEEFHKLAPHIARCKGYNGPDYVKDAIRLGCQKVQLFKPYFDEAMVREAHEGGVLCNVFFADDPDEAKRYFDMGIDCVLTNNYLAVSVATGIK